MSAMWRRKKRRHGEHHHQPRPTPSRAWRASSAITLITKSGTNQIHGSAFEFHDDQHLKARNFFQQAGTDKPLSIYNNFGATIGGPIRKNKLFYFLSYDGTRQRQASPGFYSVPTADQRVGRLQRVLATGSSTIPTRAIADGTGRTPFAGNMIPTNRLDPIALKLQSYYPLPNVPGAGTLNNYFAAGGPILSRNYFDAKINFTVNDKRAIWGKYGRMWATVGRPAGVRYRRRPRSGRRGSRSGRHADSGRHHRPHAHVLAAPDPGWRVRLRAPGPGGDPERFRNQLRPAVRHSEHQRSGLRCRAASRISLPAATPVSACRTGCRCTRIEESYTHSDNLTLDQGRARTPLRLRPGAAPPEPLAAGDRQRPARLSGLRRRPDRSQAAAPAPNQYNAYATFLLGLDTDDAEKSLQYILSTGREWQFGWYVRDRWQVSRNLTINLGLRYEFYPLMTRAGKGIERYDPATNQVLLGGRGRHAG